MVKKVLFAAGALLVAATVSAFVFSNSCSNGDIRYSAPEFKKMTTARFELMTDELVGGGKFSKRHVLIQIVYCSCFV